jgi:hypothetical protein
VDGFAGDVGAVSSTIAGIPAQSGRDARTPTRAAAASGVRRPSLGALTLCTHVDAVEVITDDRRSCGPGSPCGNSRLHAAIPGRDVRGMDRSRRSFAPRPTTKDANLQIFYGSDGTRTRDLRRDRPVLPLPGWAGTSGDFWHEQDFRVLARGDYRVPARASGDLPRDVRGMKRCLSWRRRDACDMRVPRDRPMLPRRPARVPRGRVERIVEQIWLNAE